MHQKLEATKSLMFLFLVVSKAVCVREAETLSIINVTF